MMNERKKIKNKNKKITENCKGKNPNNLMKCATI